MHDLKHRLLIPKAPEYVHLELTYRCNCRCPFCYNPESSRFEEMDTDGIKRIIDSLFDAQVFGINLTGGEPLLREDFFEIAEYAHTKDFRLHLNTNGTVLSHADCQRIARLVPRVCVTLLGSTSQIHNRMTETPRSFQMAVQGIEALADAGVEVQVNMTVTRTNLHDIIPTAKLAKSLGANWFLSSRVVAAGRGAHQRQLILRGVDIHAMLCSLEVVERECDLRVAIPSPIPLCLGPNHREKLRQWNIQCNVGFMLACISPNGDVRPCTLYPFACGNILDTSFEQLWASHNFQQFRNLEHIPKRCKSCKYFLQCKAGCRATGFWATGNLSAEDPLCVKE